MALNLFQSNTTEIQVTIQRNLDFLMIFHL